MLDQALQFSYYITLFSCVLNSICHLTWQGLLSFHYFIIFETILMPDSSGIWTVWNQTLNRTEREWPSRSLSNFFTILHISKLPALDLMSAGNISATPPSVFTIWETFNKSGHQLTFRVALQIVSPKYKLDVFLSFWMKNGKKLRWARFTLCML